MTQASQNLTDQRKVPAWVGIVLIVVCLGAGGAFIWWVLGSPMGGGSDFIPDPNHMTPNRPRVTFQAAPNPESIRKTSAGYIAQADGTVMNIDTASATPKFSFRYLRKDLVPQDVQDVLIMKFRILQDDAVAQTVGLTDDQRQKLSKISSNLTHLYPSNAERDKLDALWKDYSSGKDKAQAEKDLLSTLKQVGNDHLAAIRKSAQGRADEIKSILSADQIKKFQNMNGGG
jgi:hypothetical protein